ncbi:nucleoporin Nup188 [Anabrus simplex]|uniref:nucleoporin Nup188 n=1 Tax=Anabrus simplex TaxID=316456 RepID=UPI0035A3D404
MEDFPDKFSDTPYTRDLWTLLAETKFSLGSSALKEQLAEVKSYLLLGLLAYKVPTDRSDKELETRLPKKLGSFVLSLRRLLGLDAIQAYDVLCHYLVHEFRGTQDALHVIVQNDVQVNLLLHDMWEFYRSERLFLLKCVNILLSPPNPEKKEIMHNFINELPSNDFVENLIRQYEFLLNEEFPVSLTHGSLMTKVVQDKWFETYLREQIEVLHNLILYVDQWNISCSQFERILQTCYNSKFGRKDDAFLKEGDLIASEFTVLVGYLQNILILFCLNLPKIPGRLQWTEIINNCQEDLIGSLNGSYVETPIVFTWTMLKVLLNPDDSTLYSQEKLGYMALNAGVFEYFDKLLGSPIFKDHTTRLSIVAYRTVYELACMVVQSFDKRDLTEIPGFLHLIGPVLRHPLNSQAMWNSVANPGPRALMLLLLEKFPVEFVPFMKAAAALVKHGKDNVHDINMLMTSMNNFAEKWYPELRLNPIYSSQVTRIGGIYMPEYRFTVPVGTRGIFIDRAHTVCTWKCEFNIFKAVFYENQCFTLQVIMDGPIEEKYIETILSSLYFMKIWIVFDGHLITAEELNVVEQIFPLMACLKTCTRVPTKVLGYCVDVLSVLLNPDCLRILDCDVLRIRSSILALKIFPYLQSVPENLSHIGCSEHFSSGAIGELVTVQETKQGCFDLLISYLSFLYKLIKNKPKIEDTVKEYMDIILPGVVYVVEEVFPRYHNWGFSNERDYDHITLKCVGIFHEILTLQYVDGRDSEPIMDEEDLETGQTEENNKPEKMSEKNERESVSPLLLLQKVILHNLIYMDSSSQLLRIIASGESAIQFNMEKRLHWFSKRHTMLVFIIRLAMSVLNRTFLLRQLVQPNNRRTRLDCELLAQPPYVSTSTKVIPTVVSYLNNVFCKYLPVMSVSLLTTFAERYPKTLLPCMGMKPRLVRELFVNKLKSRLETSSLKESLLILISTCCEYQPGMCQALFNIQTVEDEETEGQNVKRPDIGCLIYLCGILRDVQEGLRDLTDILYAPTVECVVAIWTGFAADIAEHLRNKVGFWWSFCSPLTNVPSVYTSSMAQVFTIISLEVFHYRHHTPVELAFVLKKFYDEEEGTVGKWFKLLAAVLRKEVPCIKTRSGTRPLEKLPLDTQFLITMKRFLMISVKHLPFGVNNAQIITVAEQLMSAMQYALSQSEDSKLKILLEMYLFVIHNLCTVPIEKKEDWISQFEIMLLQFSSTYAVVGPQERAVFLAVIVKEISHLSDLLKTNSAVAFSMLKSSKEILYNEMNFLVAFGRLLLDSCHNITQGEISRGPIHQQTRSAKLALCLFHNLLNISAECVLWFKECQFSPVVEFLIAKFGDLMRLNHNSNKVTFHLEVAEHILWILVTFSRHGIIKKFHIAQVQTQMFLQLIPPEHLDPVRWLNSEWVDVYKPALDFITCFISGHGVYVVPQVVNFVAMHVEYLRSAIVAIKHTFKSEVLNLSIVVLNLVRELADHRSLWVLHDRDSFELLGCATMTCLSTCVAFLTNPTMLRKWTDCHQTSVKKDVFLHHICNQLLEMIYMSFAVLQAFTPRLSVLMTDPEAEQLWSPLVELNFNSPLIEPSTHSLTFGALIALAHLCTQAITKTIRVSSPGVLLRSARMGLGLGSSMALAMDKNFTCKVFEMSVELITSQALLYLLGNKIPYHEKPNFQKTLNTEMTFLWVYVERIYRQKLVASVSDPDQQYLTSKKYLPFLQPTRNKMMYERKPVLVFRRSPEAKKPLQMDEKAKDENKDIAEACPSSFPSTPKNDSQKSDDDESEKYILFLAKVFHRLVVVKSY